VYFVGAQSHGCETDHAFLSSAEVVKAWRHTSTLSAFTARCFFGYRGNFTFMSTGKEVPLVL